LAEITPKECHAFPSWYNIGTTQIGKSPAIPPPIWKKPTPLLLFLGYQSAKECHVFNT
jgi:hypothetical protein